MRNWEYYLAVVSHDANIDALKHTRRAAMQTSWIWELLLVLALCAALAFFLIEVFFRWSASDVWAMQNSWIWELLLVLALCAALTFFLIEVWQIVEFLYR
jgi:H+/Cl- antiporter ClcA